MGRRLLVAFVFLRVCTYGQATTSRVLGVVEDSTRASVRGANVALTNEGTRATFFTKTSESGAYVFEAVQPGTYTVSAEASGFKKFTSSGNAVTIGQPTTVNITLEVGSVTEQVEVVAAAEAVQTSTSGNFGNLLRGEQIRSLPIVGVRGRNPLTLVDLQPGVIDTQEITGGAVHVFGARDRAWNFTLDGIDINETSTGGSNFSPLRTNPDALAEFRVITTNQTAEYGRNSGGQVMLVSRSGSNELHGTGFEFYRTPRLDANEWQNNFNALGKRQFVQHIFGSDIGGPIWRNHTFFFFNGQWLRALNSYSVTRTVYTASARGGILRFVPGGRNGNAGAAVPSVDRAGNVIAGVTVANYDIASNDPKRLGLDKTVLGLVQLAPLPNRFDIGDGLNTAGFNFAAAQHERQHDILFKIDHIINAKNTVYARVAFGDQDTNCDRANDGLELFPGTGCQVNTLRTPRNLAFNWRWNPAPMITNELVVGQNRFAFDFQIPTNSLEKMTLANPPVAIPFYSFGNARTLRAWQVVDNLGYQVAAHAFKLGVNLRFQSHLDTRGSIAGLNATQDVDFEADFNPAAFNIPASLNARFDLPTFEKAINFLLGRVGTVSRGFAAKEDRFVPGLFHFDAHYNEYDFYAQDTWKVRKNLTLDFGLRLEMKLAPTDPEGLFTRPNQPLIAGAPPTNAAQWVKGPLFNDRLNNWGPSVGLAWDPFSHGKTSIRANYRIAYDTLNTFVVSSQIVNNLPGLTVGYSNSDFGQTDTRLTSVKLVTDPGVNPADFRQPPPFSQSRSISVFDPNFKYPTTHEWAFSIEAEVARHTVAQVAYVGRRGYHLLGAYNANQPNIFASGFINAFNVVKSGGQSELINRMFSADNRVGGGETASDMLRREFRSALQLNSVAFVAASLAARVQGGRSVTSLSGAGAFSLIGFPQFGGGVIAIDSNDFSTYHGLVLQLERRFHNGIGWQVSYTLSKALATRSFDPTFSVVRTGISQAASSSPFDMNNRKLNYGPPDYDQRHVWQSNWTVELPFGRGKRLLANSSGMVDRFVGGWEVAGFLTYYSGRPFTVYSGANTFTNVVQSPANCNGCSHDLGQVFDQNGVKFFFNADQQLKFSAPAAGELGNTGRGYFRGPRVFNVSMALLKVIKLTERTNLELRADSTNLTNTVSWGLPTAVITSNVFGRIRDNVESSARKVQLGLKVHF